ncbi:MAG: nucleoside triphosphate pyrophosphohydrolase [Schwartzia sp.]|nr:nucleoside triphosphate pyrophosphohydrolase [Schwartzia sp. (in: firmicutes)]
MGTIKVVGLGPGEFGSMTVEAWETIQNAPTLILRTAVHPTVEELSRLGIAFSSYDERYEKADNFEALYASIADDLIARAKAGENIVYAVPGSPLVAERTVALLRERAERENVPLTILPGMSFAEALCARLGVDPVNGLLIMDAADLDLLPMDWPTGLIVTQVYSPATASEAKLALMEALPDEYEIVIAQRIGLPDESVRKIPLFMLDRQSGIDHLTSLYVPPLPRAGRFDFSPLTDIMRQLREPGGCPWDRVQTPESLRKHVLEEAYEVVEAIDEKDAGLLAEELGDLLLQIVFQARIAEETGAFSMQDVVDGITEKLVRRHPHIFGDVQAEDAAAVLANWEAIKRREKPERKSRLDGVPKELSALMAAAKLQGKAADAGFDWDDVAPVFEKCREEWWELKEAVEQKDSAHVEEELGDLLFAVVNLSRFLKVNAELALLAANRKFKRRFRKVEEKVEAAGGDWKQFTLQELDAFWDDAKRAEAKKDL